MVWRARRAYIPVLGICWVIDACAGHSNETREHGGSGGGVGKAGSSGTAGMGGSSGAGAKAGSTTGGVSGSPRPNGAGGAGDAGKSGAGGAGGETEARGGRSDRGISGSLAGATDGGASGASPSRGCDSPSAWSSNLVGCEGEWVHRPNAGACAPSPRELGGDGGQAGATGRASSGAGCETDADCTAHPDGYCLTGFQSAPACEYSCRTDADCARDELCACDATRQRPSSLAALTIGTCVPATCHTDQDCPTGRLCVAPLEVICVQDSNARPQEFHCQAPGDECGGRGDCAAQAGSPNEDYEFSCNYDDRLGHTACGSPIGC